MNNQFIRYIVVNVKLLYFVQSHLDVEHYIWKTSVYNAIH